MCTAGVILQRIINLYIGNFTAKTVFLTEYNTLVGEFDQMFPNPLPEELKLMFSQKESLQTQISNKHTMPSYIQKKLLVVCCIVFIRYAEF